MSLPALPTVPLVELVKELSRPYNDDSRPGRLSSPAVLADIFVGVVDPYCVPVPDMTGLVRGVGVYKRAGVEDRHVATLRDMGVRGVDGAGVALQLEESGGIGWDAGGEVRELVEANAPPQTVPGDLPPPPARAEGVPTRGLVGADGNASGVAGRDCVVR